MTKAKAIARLKEHAARLDEIAEEKAALDRECKSVKDKAEKMMQKHFPGFCGRRNFPNDASGLEDLFDLYDEMAGDASGETPKSGQDGVE